MVFWKKVLEISGPSGEWGPPILNLSGKRGPVHLSLNVISCYLMLSRVTKCYLVLSRVISKQKNDRLTSYA